MVFLLLFSAYSLLHWFTPQGAGVCVCVGRRGGEHYSTKRDDHGPVPAACSMFSLPRLTGFSTMVVGGWRCVCCVCVFFLGGGDLKDSGFRNDRLMPGSIKFSQNFDFEYYSIPLPWHHSVVLFRNVKRFHKLFWFSSWWNVQAYCKHTLKSLTPRLL